MFSIRDAAIHVLQAVAKDFGPDWARDHIVPQVPKRFAHAACREELSEGLGLAPVSFALGSLRPSSPPPPPPPPPPPFCSLRSWRWQAATTICTA